MHQKQPPAKVATVVSGTGPDALASGVNSTTAHAIATHQRWIMDVFIGFLPEELP
jgi:hypothetical protein